MGDSPNSLDHDTTDDLTVTAVAFSPDGKTLVTGDTRGRVGFRDLATGTLTSEWSDHEDTVTGVAFFVQITWTRSWPHWTDISSQPAPLASAKLLKTNERL